MARAADFSVSEEEVRSQRRRRLRWIVLLVTLIALAIGGFFGARPAGRAIKAFQARRHAQKAFAFIEQEKWKEAQESATAAYQLRPSEPEAIRAVARFLSRVRQPQALEFWDKLRSQASLGREDLRDETAIALQLGDIKRAEAAVQELTASNPTPADWLLAAQLATQKNDAPSARTALQRVFAAEGTAGERERFQAALLELAVARATAASDPASADHAAHAASQIEALATSQSSIGLAALVTLAQHALSVPAGSGETSAASPSASPRPEPPDASSASPARSLPFKLPVDELRQRLEAHPLATAPQKLLVLDLAIHQDAGQRDAMISRAVQTWKDAPPPDLAALAIWLNGKGEYQRHLDNIALEQALQSPDLFLQHVDALGALGRWNDIRQLLEAERFPLEPVVQYMYLARCHAQLGQKAASANNWQRALEAAAGDVRQLMVLGQYAEKNGALEIAESCFTQVAARARALRPAQDGRLRLALQRRDSRKIHDVVKEMLAVWPNEAALQNDEAYMRLLLSPPSDPAAADELKQIEELATRLVQQNPASLPHRTLLALARLRQKESSRVAEVYEKVVFTSGTVTPSAMAVHAAAMAANGQTDDARKEAALVPRDKLLPEERALIADLL